MKRKLIVIAIAALTAVVAQAGNSTTEVAAGPAAFARLKTLVGEWGGDMQMGKVHASYELIAGGTSLVVKETGEKMPAMLTVFYLDGDRLMLTHYWMAGNQPRMQARAFNSATGEVSFQFLDATNLVSPGAGHMHNAKIRIADSDHYTDEWEFFENGQSKMTHAAQYTRIK